MKITKAKILKIRERIEKMAATLPDDEAETTPELFPTWHGDGRRYEVGERVQYDDRLYKCIIAHDSQKTWDPVGAVSLWALVISQAESGSVVVPLWRQPDSTNPYMKGDKVQYDDYIWESLVDNNVWAPGPMTSGSIWKQLESVAS